MIGDGCLNQKVWAFGLLAGQLTGLTLLPNQHAVVLIRVNLALIFKACRVPHIHDTCLIFFFLLFRPNKRGEPKNCMLAFP